MKKVLSDLIADSVRLSTEQYRELEPWFGSQLLLRTLLWSKPSVRLTPAL